jgi:serine/threonine-protein kinase HipA
MNHRCLYCLQPLDVESSNEYHAKCSRAFFGSTKAPELPYGTSELHELARQTVGRSISVTGVQPKLSLAFEKNVKAGVSRLTLVGLWGNFILKPPHATYPELVENEHLTMILAQLFGISTVPFSLIRLQSGELAYITRRIDRSNGHKLALEDFCQLSERLTEYKYRGSVEQVAKVVRRFSNNPGLDVLRFFELVLFCHLTGNADMHLKNHSLLTDADGSVQLAPAYDLVATKLAMPQDPEDSALTINGKKSRLKLADFQAFASSSGIPGKAVENSIKRFSGKIEAAFEAIQASFLSGKMQSVYHELLEMRWKALSNS